VPARDLVRQFRELSEENHLEEEFNKVSSTICNIMHKTVCKLAENVSKNRRDVKYAPCEHGQK